MRYKDFTIKNFIKAQYEQEEAEKKYPKDKNIALVSPVDWTRNRYLTVSEVWPGNHLFGTADFSHVMFIATKSASEKKFGGGMHQPYD